MNLTDYLDDCAARYNPTMRMLGVTWNGPGYHTRVPNGTWAHPTRESLDYALALLQAGAPDQTARAADIIHAVLALQDGDPTNRTYGIWPWLGEESLSEMAPPDWNWADFCGARLAQMLADHSALLPVDLAHAMRVALGHAAWSIFRRNVGPGYTNIAIMGAGVALAAGELLDEPRLAEYGRARLHRFVEHTAWHGGLNEYNSPTYTIVVLHECERILHLVRDPQARADTEAIRRIAWETIAEHFHPPTQQWAGPCSRVYGDRLDAGTAAYLEAQSGVAIAPHPTAAPRSRTGPTHIPALPCPPDLVERFRQIPASPLEIRRRFIRRADGELSLEGITWMDELACLGSVNQESLWTQRRPLVAYWRTAADPAVVLRARFLRDGQDFATAAIHSVQHGARVLGAIGLYTDRGDYHLHLDRPAAGRFASAELRLRFELRGIGVQGRQLAPELYELAAGERRALIHAPAGSFGGRPVRWELTQLADGIAVDAICATVDDGVFDPASTSVRLAFGLEILAPGESPAPPQRLNDGATAAEAEWNGLRLKLPAQAGPYPW